MKRALGILAFAVGYVLTYLFVLHILLYIAYSLESDFQLRYAGLVAIVSGNALMIGLLIYFRHRTRDRWIRAEAERWLAERSRQTHRAHPLNKWAQRRVPWIPSGFVLLIVLFFPET